MDVSQDLVDWVYQACDGQWRSLMDLQDELNEDVLEIQYALDLLETSGLIVSQEAERFIGGWVTEYSVRGTT